MENDLEEEQNNAGTDNEEYNSTENSVFIQQSIEFIENLLKLTPELIILELTCDRVKIKQITKKQISDDLLVLLVELLTKIVESSPLNDKRYSLIQNIMNEKFLETLTTFIATLPTKLQQKNGDNRLIGDNTDRFWLNLLQICDDLLKTTPTFGYRISSAILKSLEIYLPLFEKITNRSISDEITSKLGYLLETIEIIKQQIESNENTNDIEPPDDFRTIDIYPTPLELKEKYPFLRANITKGAYKSVNHYLDVQFRLLREDFVAPLRRGIENFLLNRKLESVRIYKRVRFICVETIGSCYTYRISFTTRRVNYEHGKYFMYGSLLCFTNNSFTTIHYGRVESREIKDLNNGELVVGFDERPNIRFKQDYLMVELTVYLEPYYRVLTVLQQLPSDNFPMEKYLIYCQNDRTKPPPPPKYLTEEMVDLQHKSVDLNYKDTFNESQLVAFKAALTQEFVLIQGPPGTGKTFIGLKIVEKLLKQSYLWNDESPMLIICYTNHALDQFLEGLLLLTLRIIRVGGQSKSKDLQKFNLREYRRLNNHRNEYLENVELDIDRKLRIIKNSSKLLLKLDNNKSIKVFDMFRNIVDGYETSWFRQARKDEILNWLFDGHNLQEVDININMNTTDNCINTDDDDSTEILPDIETFLFVPDLISVEEFQITIEASEENLKYLDKADMTQHKSFRRKMFQDKINELKSKYRYLNKRLEQNRLKQYKQPSYINLEDPYKMSYDDRWFLYFQWLEQYKKRLIKTIDYLNDEYRETYKRYEKERETDDIELMKGAQIIGMTTTCAARLHKTLQRLKSPIVIVEEAAEILETHIITALTQHCQHLILIGDHQQLKPNTADYRIETKYKLGISLFERMILNRVQLYTLDVQHRMRPEIAQLTTLIYPFLKNHDSVNNRPFIKGTDHVLYFIDHQIYEENNDNEDDTSKRNLHEAEFLLAYANHLILNGYNPADITIIAAYLGQMYEMYKIRKQYKLLTDLRIVVLDNYQGEESDIILLSLVRSNRENKIGFLNNANRVCVALSRARDGLFIIGNMRQLMSQSDLWLKIYGKLKKQNAIGPTLTLRCQNHPDNVTNVQKADDFLQIAEGGCYERCNLQLPCQHYCKKLCHIMDYEHKFYKCRELCNRLLCDENDTHLCKRQCYEVCPKCYYEVLKQLPCGHEGYLECSQNVKTYKCRIMINVTLPCGHETEKPCSKDIKTYPCPYPCDIKVEPCGHSCTLKCHINKDPDHLGYRCEKPCARFMKNCTQKLDMHICKKLCCEECDECDIIVKKKLQNCSHTYNVPCTVDVNTVHIDCKKLCTKILPCGHKCKNPCNRPCGGCNEIVDKTIEICGHILRTECSKEPDRKLCKQKCPLLLHCGHPCTKKCNEPCTTQCEFLVTDSFIGDCGHTIEQSYCYMKTTNNYADKMKLLRFCTQLCTATLKCNHKCTGNCAECYQNRLHKPCQEKCTNRLICDHQCQLPCHSVCRPCTQQCTFKCVHSDCKKICGELCTPCKRPCTQKCEHQKCKKLCSVQCKMTQCSNCDTNTVMLKDCQHIVQTTVVHDWLQQTNDNVGFKTCPHCDTSIKTTEKYSDYIKQAYIDIYTVKKRLMENSSKQYDSLRQNLLAQINKLPRLPVQFEGTNFGKFLKKFKQRLKPAFKNKQQFDCFLLNSIARKYQIIKEIFLVCDLQKSQNLHKLINQQLNLITKGLQSDSNDYLSDQQIDDIQLELLRLLRIYQLNHFEQSLITNNPAISDLYQQLLQKLSQTSKYVNDADVQKSLQEINYVIGGDLIVTNYKFQPILPVLSFTKANWLKCPKGHIYSLAEYNGNNNNNSKIKCNECRNKN